MLDKVFLNICFTTSSPKITCPTWEIWMWPPQGGCSCCKKNNHHLRNLPKCKPRRWTSPTSLATNHWSFYLWYYCWWKKTLHPTWDVCYRRISVKKTVWSCPWYVQMHLFNTQIGKKQNTLGDCLPFSQFLFSVQKLGKRAFLGPISQVRYMLHVVFPLGWYTYGFWMA